MATEAKILVWWILFAGTHIGGSSRPVRTVLVNRLGLGPFKGLYSLVALATFIPLCWVYLTDRHTGALLFSRVEWLRHVTEALMLLAIVQIAQGSATPHPLATVSELSGAEVAGARGIQRITRHPTGVGVALFGTAHALSNPTVGDWLFFGGFVVFSVLGGLHQDRRALASHREAVRRFHAETSFLPFAAILAGRQRLVLRELRPMAALVAVAVFVLLRIVHGRLIGGFGG